MSPVGEGPVRLGIDVGGTFTDVVADWPGGSVRTKVPSTPDDPARGVLGGCDQLARELGGTAADLLGRVTRFGLGTTVVTNLLATQGGRRLGLITTAGFEHLIPLARGHLVPEGGWLVRPPLLVDLDNIVGVRERCDATGTVLQRPDDDEIESAARRLVETRGAEALVVSFLWSFRNPENEEHARRVLADRLPGVRVVVASELAPVIREYERTQFALLNAYVDGALDWLDGLQQELRARGLRAPVVLMHSTGGAVSLPAARAVPIGLAQSGPAAGTAAAVALAREMGDAEAVACDMGGTSLDVALVSHGQPLRRTRGRLVGHWTALSMVDVDSVGSGGGSVAWLDSVGALRVGPRSAGASPGPACYGRGGTEPTVTDALLVLGYLDPETFLGGRMRLDADAARAACARLGEPLGMGVEEVAWGIREVALTLMGRAVRRRLASRGLSGSDLALVAYGGCGPLFGADLGAAVGARRVVVPALASVFSAHGAATSPLRRERSASLVVRLPGDDAALRETFARLSAEASADLLTDGVAAGRSEVSLEAEMRFERQAWELTIPLHDRRPADVTGQECLEAFTDEYARRFGKGALATGVGVELVTCRAVATETDPPGVAVGARPAVALPHPLAADGAGPPLRPTGSRRVRLSRREEPLTVPVHAGALAPGGVITGPALVDAPDTTVWIPSARAASVTGAGTLLIAEGAA